MGFKKRNYFMLTLLVLCVTTFWISFCLKCCRINKDIESRFNTPYFDTTRFDKDGNLKQSEKDSPSSSLPQKDDKQKQKLVENDDDHKEIEEIEEIEDEQDDLGKIYDL